MRMRWCSEKNTQERKLCTKFGAVKLYACAIEQENNALAELVSNNPITLEVLKAVVQSS